MGSAHDTEARAGRHALTLCSGFNYSFLPHLSSTSIFWLPFWTTCTAVCLVHSSATVNNREEKRWSMTLSWFSPQGGTRVYLNQAVGLLSCMWITSCMHAVTRMKVPVSHQPNSAKDKWSIWDPRVQCSHWSMYERGMEILQSRFRKV
jgi:hypothetical protein